MLHEVLLALMGHNGALFPDTEHGIKVVLDVPFLSASESSHLDQLCDFVSQYKRFVSFINTYGDTLSYDTDTSGLHGLYLKAFCQGLDDVLQTYRLALIDLEKEILSDPHLSLCYIHSRLNQFHLLFVGLSSLLSQIETQKAHGCYLLDVLHKNSYCGIADVETAVKRILERCNRGLYKHLSSWLLYGHLNDPYEEFFIQPFNSDEVPDPHPATDDDDLGLAGVTGRQLKRLLHEPPVKLDKFCPFTIRADLLPSYISTRLAEKILFIGESVRIFESGNIPYSSKDTFMRTQEDTFARRLHQLSQKREIDVAGFESLVDDIRSCVAERLWVLVVKDSNLIQELAQMKDLILLGRGELYRVFIDAADPLLDSVPGPNTQHDVNRLLQQCARSLHIDDDIFLHKFHLTVSIPADKKIATNKTPETGWSNLGIAYSTQWPLHILFTPRILATYNPVFVFLMRIKRAQYDLHACWMSQKHLVSLTSRQAHVCCTRNRMLFLIDNFQYYMQVDVIESLYSMLIDTIENTQDIEEVKVAHERFVSSLLAQSFVHLKPVSNRLNEILNLCFSFTKLSLLRDPTPEHEKQMDSIILNFQRESSLLFRILSEGRSFGSSPHLSQLLLRLDYNRYYSSTGGLGR